MKKILIILSLILTISCELEKEIDSIFVYGGDKIVVKGFISKEDGVHINLKKTVNPTNSNTNDILGNTTVKLFKNNTFYSEIPRLDDYHFALNDLVDMQYNDSFYIEVNAEGLEKVNSTPQIIFPKTSISNISFDTLQDKVQIQFYKNLKDEKFILQQKYYSDSKIIGFNERKIFNENTGLEHIVSNFNNRGSDSIQIKLIKLSPDYFRFIESLEYYDYTFDNSFFETVTPVYSNIQSGYGIFGSYAFDKVTYINP